jgi:hypothetical protein
MKQNLTLSMKLVQNLFRRTTSSKKSTPFSKRLGKDAMQVFTNASTNRLKDSMQ